ACTPHDKQALTYVCQGPRQSPRRPWSSWFRTIFSLTVIECIFGLNPFSVVAYFIALIRGHTSSNSVPAPYVVTIAVATLKIHVLASSLCALWPSRSQLFITPGRNAQLMFVTSQVAMTTLWLVVFVYVMVLSRRNLDKLLNPSIRTGVRPSVPYDLQFVRYGMPSRQLDCHLHWPRNMLLADRNFIVIYSFSCHGSSTSSIK
ncbi:hypothetical protein V1512DRAFT_159487, partial [Lipomyces arxii]|uniref:uncharacterized protein n=1 Tax=Lipomyces arxii TaxID=56418 RepID=UPI0034CF4E85